MENKIHIPVLLDEVLQLVPKISSAVDFTFGYGGHSAAISANWPDANIYGFDRDLQIINLFIAKNPSLKKIKLRQADFISACKLMNDEGIKVDFVLADLGLSSLQIDDSMRGFSFNSMGPLDMRMDQETGITAADFINSASVEELARVFKEYGEEPFAKLIAKKIVEAREIAPIETTQALTQLIVKCKPKIRKHHQATLVFQALRVYVNNELEQLDYLLNNILNIVNPGAVVAFITFNSLEDRAVKMKFNSWKQSCICPKEMVVCTCRGKPLVESIIKKFVLPGKKELKLNSRARSAKLRAVQVL